MQSFKSDDDTTRLLNALKPFLSEDKRQKLDRAEKLIKLVRMIPMLRESGILSGF